MTYSYKYKRKNDSLWHNYLNKLSKKLSAIDTPTLITAVTILTYILIVFVGAYVLLRRTGVLPPNAFGKLLWRVFVYAIPPSLVMALERREQSNKDSEDPFEDENSYAATRTFGAKSQAVKRILGLHSGSISRSIALGARLSINKKSQALPGLFNRDNECYQNSIIQGLASLGSFCEFVEKLPSESPVNGHATLTGALQAIILGLNSPDNHGKGLWTPWALKSMSSWQQQDAQEYYSRVIDEVEKDIKRSIKARGNGEGSLLLESLAPADGTTSAADDVSRDTQTQDLDLAKVRNPLEGLQAQRVGCLQCGYVEGLSLIPFNCVTVSLGRQTQYDIESLLDSYTDLETISGVECAKCTLLKQEKILERLIQLRSKQDEGDTSLQTNVQDRLEVVQMALKDEDFSEATLSKKCQVSGKARVQVDKTKQSVIARAPQSLVIHINRSVFDERTGTQLKNYSQVQFPRLLNLDQWCLGSSELRAKEGLEVWETDPSVSMVAAPEDNAVYSKRQPGTPKALYTLRALITHYGTHGDGHYVAWRQDSSLVRDNSDSKTWWRLSDDDVVQFDEETVLRQGGVFMLFYERIASPVEEREPEQPTDTEPAQENTETIASDLDSPTSFLSSEIKAALDEKLDKYHAPKDIPVLVADSPAKKAKVAPIMRTASEAKPMIPESVGGLMNVA